MLAIQVPIPCWLMIALQRPTKKNSFSIVWLNSTQELDEIIRENQKGNQTNQRHDVLEIFSGPQSQLTHQCKQLGFKAERFGYAQGDLQTISGRNSLFWQLVKFRPRHAWVSPTCGPRSGFSSLNGSRSVAAWDELQNQRYQHISQVELCAVIYRYRRSNNNHFHWEQPRGSLMFMLPYLEEVIHYSPH